MANDRENQQQQKTGSAENLGSGRKEQFNELSELSLEERIKFADQLGVPVENVSDVAVMGGTTGRDDVAGGPNDGMKEEVWVTKRIDNLPLPSVIQINTASKACHLYYSSNYRVLA